MSKNRNRAKLKKVQTSKEYSCFYWMEIYSYDEWDYGWNFNHGDFPNHKWREYKTWKHNRKTQWKE